MTKELANFATVGVFGVLTSQLASRALLGKSDQMLRLDGEEISERRIRYTSMTEQTSKTANCGVEFTTPFRRTVVNTNAIQLTSGFKLIPWYILKVHSSLLEFKELNVVQ